VLKLHLDRRAGCQSDGGAQSDTEINERTALSIIKHMKGAK